MTENKDEKKSKKLTLGGGKLTLGGKSSAFPKKLSKTLGGSSSGAVVVEVKRGKATGGGLSLRREAASDTNAEQTNRRLAALQRSKEEASKEDKISTLSQLAEMNQAPEAPEEKEPAKQGLPVNEGKAVSTKKDYSKSKPQNTAPEKESSEKSEEQEVAKKPKQQEPKKMKKSDIFQMLDQESDNIPVRTRSLASIERAKAKKRRKNSGEAVKAEKVYREVILPELITVTELANRMTERAVDVTSELMKLGVMATGSQPIDADTAEIIVTGFLHNL